VKRVLPIALAVGCFAGCLGPAWAGWSVSGDVESFRWRESTTPSITESGPRYGIGGSWIQEKDAGWLLGWRGKLYWGSVDYNGSLLFSGAPATSTTEYAGASNELQAIYRPYAGNLDKLDFVGSLGLDAWERKLSVQQKEEYTVAFARLGIEYNGRASQGWFGGGGIKKPIYAREDAHLRDIGFDQNPILRPGKDPSLYGQVGYRFNTQWSLLGYYDSYRFGRSSAVTVTASRSFPGTTFSVFQPQSRIDLLGLRLQFTF
jgi:hypothetical protein